MANLQQQQAEVWRSLFSIFLEIGSTLFPEFENLSVEDSPLVELGNGRVIDLSNSTLLVVRGFKNGQEKIVLVHPQGGYQVVKGGEIDV